MAGGAVPRQAGSIFERLLSTGLLLREADSSDGEAPRRIPSEPWIARMRDKGALGTYKIAAASWSYHGKGDVGQAGGVMPVGPGACLLIR